ncbi:MAG: glutaredoxin 3 [Hyphomicrobiaceae bacterium]|nr:glutaredoxin 3 [Hyphomicrobiaceae bacterium]
MAEVEIYTRALCGYCLRAKRLLNDKGVPFTEHDATYDTSLRNEMIKKAHGQMTYPQIFIDGRHIGGCDDLFALDRAGKLDPLLQA